MGKRLGGRKRFAGKDFWVLKCFYDMFLSFWSFSVVFGVLFQMFETVCLRVEKDRKGMKRLVGPQNSNCWNLLREKEKVGTS